MAAYLDKTQTREVAALSRTFIERTEWPTWLLIASIHGGWLGVVIAVHAGHLSLLAATPLLIVLCAWHMSLQHELLHGHPTRSVRFNQLLGSVPLSIWYPYRIYRDSHLAHHRDARLTTPGLDPESNYVLDEQWRAASPLQRGLWRARKTFIGRLVVGPPLSIVTMLKGTFDDWRRGELRYVRVWSVHAVIVVALLFWLQRFEGISWWYYLLVVTWPALSLAMIRSLYEHRADRNPKHRIAINEAGWAMRLLYLNNNYHLVHHDLPHLPWYHLPRVYRVRRNAYAARNGSFVIHGGYWELLKCYAWHETDVSVHPGFAGLSTAPGNGHLPSVENDAVSADRRAASLSSVKRDQLTI
jgi:fatty acid desaturase